METLLCFCSARNNELIAFTRTNLWFFHFSFFFFPRAQINLGDFEFRCIEKGIWLGLENAWESNWRRKLVPITIFENYIEANKKIHFPWLLNISHLNEHSDDMNECYEVNKVKDSFSCLRMLLKELRMRTKRAHTYFRFNSNDLFWFMG